MLLYAHQLVKPRLLHFLWHVIVVVLRRIGPVFLGIGKCAHPLKARPLGEFDEFLEIAVGLTWETDHQRRAQMNPRHLAPHPANQLHRLFLRHVALHTRQHVV